VLNGTKAWITNAGPGRLFVVIAVSEPGKGARGMSAFLVESSFAGFRVSKEEDKLGLRSSKTAEIVLEDCRVPAANLLGREGDGIKIALATLDGARIGIAAQSVGIARGALDEAVSYAKQRQAFGKPIAELQAVSFMLADMAMQIDAARLLCHRAAWLRDQGRPYKKEASMAKLYASEMSNRAVYAALQIHGGYGYSKDYAVERMYRDARVTTLYEGTSEIQRFVIARELLKD
jgi:alkylation response protein AidB-like acyl-CoA dehydrogenase